MFIFACVNYAESTGSLFQSHRLDGVVVERPPRVREVAGLIPDRFIPTTLTMVVMAALLGSQGFRVSMTTAWLVSGYIDQLYWKHS